jgi:predicted Zn finger-like uncharacterized protein
MALTFECGVCHSIYRLDEHQITANGVKITCPKCLNYFFLKKGASEANEAPVVEYIVPDGAYDISAKVQAPVKEAIRAPQAAPPKEPKRSGKTNPDLETADYIDPFYPPTANTKLTEADLSDYPADTPPKSPIDQYFWWLAMILAAIIALLILNFLDVVRIPGLEQFRRRSEISGEAVPVPTPSATRTPKYGFPKVETGYDPWAGASALPTPAPEVTPQP